LRKFVILIGNCIWFAVLYLQHKLKQTPSHQLIRPLNNYITLNNCTPVTQSFFSATPLTTFNLSLYFWSYHNS